MLSSESITIENHLETDIDICSNELFNTKFGKTYYPSIFILKNILHEAMKKDNIFVAKYNGNILGFIWFSKNTMFGKFPYLNLIFVFEKYRGVGAGSKLLNCFETKVFEDSINPKMKLFLVVKSDNNKAIHFYQKNGYSTIGVIDGLFRSSKNEVLMMKNLNYEF